MKRRDEDIRRMRLACVCCYFFAFCRFLIGFSQSCVCNLARKCATKKSFAQLLAMQILIYLGILPADVNILCRLFVYLLFRGVKIFLPICNFRILSVVDVMKVKWHAFKSRSFIQQLHNEMFWCATVEYYEFVYRYFLMCLLMSLYDSNVFSLSTSSSPSPPPSARKHNVSCMAFVSLILNHVHADRTWTNISDLIAWFSMLWRRPKKRSQWQNHFEWKIADYPFNFSWPLVTHAVQTELPILSWMNRGKSHMPTGGWSDNQVTTNYTIFVQDIIQHYFYLSDLLPSIVANVTFVPSMKLLVINWSGNQ